ncbi:MAG: radical SAM protein, partial [Actinobacteria bacterium]|nr:radical SAM protein [Actinomycetota bacterium]
MNNKINNCLIDSYNRKIDYLRLSVTDRCNLRCIYCMPADGIKLYKQNEVLSYEEVLKAVKILAELGIKKVRLTGGEPLLRENILRLIGSLGKIKGIEDISLTTNGILLLKYAEKLRDLGIKRVNISLDTLDPDKYRKITRGGDLKAVLNSIDRALMAGISNIKINVVISDYLDEKDIEGFISMAFNKPFHVRFIEAMQAPFSQEDISNIECSSTSGSEFKVGKNQFELKDYQFGLKKHDIILKKIFLIMRQFGDFVREEKPVGFGPAIYYRIKESRGSVGFILNDKIYCSACNRLRLSSSGSLQLCLFSDLKLDLKSMLRQGKKEEEIRAEILDFVKAKPENREEICRFNYKNDNKNSNKINNKNRVCSSLNLKLSDYMSK